MSRCLPLFFALCFLLVSGCARPLVLTVDSMGTPGQDARYVILPGMDSVRGDDLFFVEYKRQLAQLLGSMGYQVTENEADATAVVLLSWQTAVETTTVHGGGPVVGMGMGSSSGGYHRSGPFFGLGVGFPLGGGSGPSRTYRYQITLDAVSFALDADSPASKSLWKVILAAADDENNLRAAFPAMLEAAKPYIGADSHGPISVSVARK